MKMKRRTTIAIAGIVLAIISMAHAMAGIWFDFFACVFLLSFGLLLCSAVMTLIAQFRGGRLKRRDAVVAAAGFLSGFLIWWLTEPLTGIHEPWDVPGLYYPVVLFVVGFLSGVLSPRGWLVCSVAIILGQFPPAFFGLGCFPLVPLFLLLYGMVAVIGAFFGSVIAKGARRCVKRDAA